MKQMAGKVAFITGGASGIGFGIASTFVDAGMRVMLADLRQDHIDDALARFHERDQGNSVRAVRVDVTDRAAPRRRGR
ncbi:MAG TPA: SDR family NAD(P)-dependent oxidoreductase [Gammaproteobacteria bacterium]|nr:SDR family NAD(P)-dependent oxidoreductase [Gammaproteobacteria bacterium]